MSRIRKCGAIAVVAVVATVGCSPADDDTVVVLAASSLVDAFDRIEAEFEAAHPGVDIVVSAGGSSTLVAQLTDGAPADVLATADLETMARAEAAATIARRPRVFAQNSMVIAVEVGNPLGVMSVADLGRVPVVVLAAAEVPAGAYAAAVLDCEGVELVVASYEQNVRAAASKVALGEADAAIVYRTDIG
ncbi:MAG: molybdate ABC transporter substrate-binding protein, partial [Ilumatobacter sp.]